MTTERLLDKLTPLIPERADRWRRALHSADANTRTLVERRVRAAAQEHLGASRGPFLSLPPSTLSDREINLGTILYGSERWPVGLSRGELLQNLAVFGRSGAGKTNFVFHVLEQLLDKRVPFLFLDWKCTARHLLPRNKQLRVFTPGRDVSPLEFNPFTPPPGVDERAHVNHCVDALASAFSLGDGARRILQQALADALQATAHTTCSELIKRVQSMRLTGRATAWKTSALRALESLDYAAVIPSQSGSGPPAKDLLKRATIVELDGLSLAAKKFFVPMLCYWVYSHLLRTPHRERLKFVIIIEEAHHVLHRRSGSGESVLEMLLRQCREIGIAVVTVDQHPHLISSAVLGNSYTSVCFNLKDPRDARTAADMSQLNKEDARCLTRLPRGQAVVKFQGRWFEPFLVSVPLVPVDKGSVRDLDLEALRTPLTTRSDTFGAVGAKTEHVRRVLSSDPPLSGAALSFLEDIHIHPHDGVKQRYQRLGLSAEKGTRLKRELVRRDWVEQALVRSGNSRKAILRLSKRVRKALRLDHRHTNESVEHEYWKHYYAAKYEHLGYSVTIEAERAGGRVDILATRGTEQMGIEIETGNSNAVSNVKNGLRSGFSTIVVIATSQSAHERVNSQLAKAGLVLDRVTTFLAGCRKAHSE